VGYTSGTIKTALVCKALDGQDPTTPLDLNPANTTDATSQYDSASSGTLGQANELVLGVFAWAGPSGDVTACAASTPTSVTSLGTTGGTASTNSNLRLCYAVVAATTAVTASATNTTSNRSGVQSISTWKIRGNVTPTTGAFQITSNGVDSSTTVGTTPAMHTVTTTSTAYPSNAAGVGINAGTGSGTAAVVLFEAGTQLVYLPAPVVSACPGWLTLLGVGC